MPRKKAPKARPPDAEPSPRPYVYEHQEESTPTTESTASSPHTLCASLADFSATFGQHLDANDQAFIPEPCHHTYRFHLTATFLVDLSRLPSLASTLPKKATLPSSTSSTSYTEIGANGSTPSQIKENAKEKEKNLYLLSTAGALNASDPDAERMAKQRAVARAIVDAVQAVDGYRYARSGGHVLKAERGSVMIFVCNDSVQNKDRLANARGLSQAQGAGRKGIGEGEGGGTGGGEGGADGGVEEEEEEGKGKKKRRGGSRLRPTYDCSGAVTVKFRSKSQVLEVEYRHLMVHRETAWRDQGPRVLTTEEVEAKKEKKRERRREERKREREKKEQERRESGTTSVTSKRKRKRGEVEAVDGIHAPFNANSESAEMYAEGNDSDTLAELLQADMHDMDQETATAVGPAMGQNGTVFATNGHLTGEMPNGSDGGKVLKKQRGGCLTCRRRKVKCDQTKPSCLACHFKSRECVWPDKVLKKDAASFQVAHQLTEPTQAPQKVDACFSCRDGKVKCDQGRPSCLACRLKKHECRYSDPGQVTGAKGRQDISDQAMASAVPPSHSQHTSDNGMEALANQQEGIPDPANGWGLEQPSSQAASPAGQETSQSVKLQTLDSSQPAASVKAGLKPRKKRRKKSPLLWLAPSPSPPPDRRPIAGFASESLHSMTSRRRFQEEYIVFEAEET